MSGIDVVEAFLVEPFMGFLRETVSSGHAEEAKRLRQKGTPVPVKPTDGTLLRFLQIARLLYYHKTSKT